MDARTKEQIKAERNERARLRMAKHRETEAYQEWLIASRERRRLLKEKYRRAAGCMPRDVIKENARIRNESIAASKAIAKAEREARQKDKNGWCDAHIKRFYMLKKLKEDYARRYAEDPEKERARSRQVKADLKDTYIRQQLFSMGLSREQITPQIIELKREQLALRRLSREAEQAAVKQMENEYEAI